MLKFSQIFVSSQLLFFFVQVNSQTFTVNNCSNHEMKDIVVEIPVRNLPISIGNYAVASKDGSTVPLEIVSNLKEINWQFSLSNA